MWSLRGFSVRMWEVMCFCGLSAAPDMCKFVLGICGV